MKYDGQYSGYNADALLEGFDNTDICVFMYFPDEARIEVPKKACDKYHCKEEYYNMPYSFADDFVHPDDYPTFVELYRKINSGEETATAIFHNKNKSACCRVTLTSVGKMEGSTRKVLGVIEDISESDNSREIIAYLQNLLEGDQARNSEIDEARLLIANAIGSQFFALYHIWLKTKTYICFQEQLHGILSVIGTTGDYEPAWDSYIEGYIVAEDREGMRRFADIHTLAERLKDKTMISHEYRRKEIGWTRGQFIVAKRDENGIPTNVIYTVADINAEKTMELEQSQAYFDAHHDALTHSLNRKALDEMASSTKLDNVPIGFAIVDVDHFKTVNDTYGHEAGDKVLIDIADLLKNIFRSHDAVFRIGGDEFAVLLYNCTSSAWNTINSKQHHIHVALAELYKDYSLTLSMGIAFSANGYSEEVFRLADERLYEVKRNGRAGCSMIDTSNRECRFWRDESLNYKTKNILEFNSAGLYRIEYPLDGTSLPRLICGDATRELFGFPKDETAEECYKEWVDNVDPSYIEVLTETRQLLLQGVQAECTYQWNHPVFGKIFIRTGGFGEVVDNLQILHGYHHSMQNTRIMERKDDRHLLIDSMSAIYFCSYYIDLENNNFYTLKNAPGEKDLEIQEFKASDALNQFLHSLVSPDYMTKMTEFVDFSTLEERLKNEVHLDCEYLSLSDKGWCRATFFPVKHNTEGKLTHVLFVITSLDEHKAREAKKGAESRKSIESLYNNVPAGLIMYEWDGQRLKTLHISAYYDSEYGYTLSSGEDGQRGPDFKRVHPDDLPGYQAAIQKALTQTHELHYDYRIWNQKKNAYLWAHIDAISREQGNGTSLVYALYTDVTEQKRMEELLERSHNSMISALSASNLLSYEYDPMTHTAVGFNDKDKYFGLPKEIQNFPDSLKDLDVIHPEDIDLFMDTARQMDAGASTARCDVRAKKDGQYNWYSCSFNSFFNGQKEHNVSIVTVADISDRIAQLTDYKNRLNSVADMAKDSLVIGQSNLSENTVDFFKASKEFEPFIEKIHTFDERISRNVDYVVSDKAKEEFVQTFNREHLLKLAEQGQMQVRMEYLLKVPGYHTMWLETGVNMVRNPLTGSVTAISYSKDIQNIRLSSLLLNNTLSRDYLKTAVVLNETDEFYVIDYQAENPANHQKDFWVYIKEALLPLMNGQDNLLGDVTKQNVLSVLEKENEYVCSFNSSYFDTDSRLQLRITYLDEERHFLFVSMHNITDMALIEQLRHDSEHDPLTDLYNRRTTFRKCREMMDKYPDEQFVMVHADIRHFRLFNTFFGEEVGDKLLCDAADMFRWMDVDYDHWVFGRIEGDVFCACFPYDQKRYEKHVEKAKKILKNYRSDFLVEPVLGVYFVNDRSMPIDAMFTRAALAAKSVETRTPYATAIYNDELEQKLLEEQMVVNDMQAAIDQRQFEVYLQPKYALRTHKAVGAEALVRWHHPHKGMISPSIFIPVFENNGFITTLDRYMWEQVCVLLKQWKDEGKPLTPISVNVSRLSMFSKSTVEYLKDLITKYDIDPQYLELELTESAYIDDPEEMKSQMLALREAGFKILLDDFGSGYSCLNTLRELPVDILKLDMKFMSINQEDVRGGLVISSIIRMAKLLKLTVIAEGVERPEQADYLKEVGCEYVQGYLYARPMPVKDYERILMNVENYPVSPEQTSINHIGRILSETNSVTYAMGAVIPTPLACLEYDDGKITFLRVNAEFFREFELDEDFQPFSQIFKQRLREESYERLVQAFEDSIQHHVKVSVSVLWDKLDGHYKKYICRLSYEGNIGNTKAVVAVFTPLPEED